MGENQFFCQILRKWAKIWDSVNFRQIWVQNGENTRGAQIGPPRAESHFKKPGQNRVNGESQKTGLGSVK